DDVEFSLKRHLERSPALQRVKFIKLSPLGFSISSGRPEDWMRLLNVSLVKPAGSAGGKHISAGPYIIEKLDRQKRRVRLKAFEKYINGPPLAPVAEYTFYNNSEMAMFGFLTDEADFMCGLSRGQEKLIGGLSDRKLVRYASHDNFMLIFNTARPLMDDILVRKAISLLMDRQSLVSKSESLQGSAIPTQYQFAMSAPVTKPHADPPAPEEASKLLQKAGYIRTAKGWEKDGKPLQLSMLLSTHHTVYIPEARIITQWLNKAGLNTTFDLASMIDYSDRQVFNKSHIWFGAIYDKMEFESNYIQFEPGAVDNLYQSTNPAPAILLAGAKSGSLTTDAKESIIRKIADFSYSAPLFYPVEYCMGKGNTGYEDAFFRSPIIFSVINRNAPSGPLRSQTGP
ncbi:MAG: ABC transporter substrate-binding protein, partial [Rectinemataceae bacterium]|nr:ABC transporter substrate-binding protein [Rectinemataceae bacterium]